VAVERSVGFAETPLEKPGDPAVRVRSVSKAFAVPRHRAWTLKERLRHPVKSFSHDWLEALEDVSFDVARGEFFAVIGHNGSGKSTLLRCVAGIHEPDAGEVEVNARIAPFIELGVGFHPELAARDNVTVAGTLMGLRPAEARRRFPRVISFAELEEFVEMRLANYSSGMQVRLAFSTSFQVDAEVLLFDEVLAVGDELFQRKCLDTFQRLIAAGHTILYVSHNLDTVRRFADRALLLERGRTIALGDPEAVVEEYQRRNRERQLADARLGADDRGRGSVLLPREESLVPSPAPVGRAATLAAIRRFADVTLMLARAEFKLRYLDSAIGYVWALLQPLLWFAVLYLIWSQVFRLGNEVPHYQLGLLLGVALFTFFSEATGHALTSLVSRGTMLRKIPFPPLALPLSSVLTSSYIYGLAMVIVLGFVLASGITPTLAWLEVVPALALLFVFTVGVSLVLSLLYVGIRDVQQVWLVISRLLFFVTPVFYPIQLVPEALQKIMMISPLAVAAVEARHALIDPSGPTAAAVAGDTTVLASIGLTALTVGAGLWLYRKWARRLAERI
jgi:ABC-type polysaccharide/polyol phosphate transport system ATPase subunit/ABC-type polysaccharide/polyol phosphate export permease